MQATINGVRLGNEAHVSASLVAAMKTANQNVTEKDDKSCPGFQRPDGKDEKFTYFQHKSLPSPHFL